jgi:hypothetical protein
MTGRNEENAQRPIKPEKSAAVLRRMGTVNSVETGNSNGTTLR